jgi:hypothetical protein
MLGWLACTTLLWVVADPIRTPDICVGQAVGSIASLAGFVLVLGFLLGAAQRGRAVDARLFVACFGLVLIKLWVVRCQALCAIGPAFIDDRLYVQLGQWIAEGKWLGTYDQFTLVKGPFYPIWIAGTYWSGLPLLLAQHLLYIVACAVWLVALRPLIRRELILVAIYGLLLFNPMSCTGKVLRAVREGIYPALTLLVLACLVGLYVHRDGPLRKMILWAGGLGISWSAFWLTREEGVWLAPTAMLLLACPVICLLRQRPPRWLARLTVCAAPLAIWAIAHGAVCAANWGHYGVFTSCEFKWHPFLAAYGALSRVEPSPWQRYIPVPKETRRRIYEVSPAFRELEGSLEGDLGAGGILCSRQVPSIAPDEIAGGWWIWVLRMSAARAGYHDHGPAAKSYYRRLAREVNHACDSGRLAAGPRRATLAPPWRPEYGPLLQQASLNGATMLVRLDGFSPQAPPSVGPEPLLHLFRTMTRERIAPMSVPSEIPPGQQALPESHRVAVLGWAYQAVMPWAVLLAGATFFLMAVVLVWTRTPTYLFALLLALAMAALIRVGLLALMEISCAPGHLDPLYMAPAYPVLILFTALAVAHGASQGCAGASRLLRRRCCQTPDCSHTITSGPSRCLAGVGAVARSSP